jgi:proline iminopeptidase
VVAMERRAGYDGPAAEERYVDVPGGALFTRTIGAGPTVVVIHGGPGTLDHTYLLPYMDGLADFGRLVYYDQRGHGRSLGALSPTDVTIERFVADLDAVCAATGEDAVTLLGHSWGAHLALRFALRHPARVARIILVNTAPVTQADHQDFVAFRRERGGSLIGELRWLLTTTAYADGDPHLEVDLLRRVFSIGIVRPMDVARLNLRVSRENVLRGRIIAQRFEETLYSQPFDLLPDLADLHVPTLVLHGDQDFVPGTIASGIAAALPRARLAVLPACGHFAYLEASDAVHAEIAKFIKDGISVRH